MAKSSDKAFRSGRYLATKQNFNEIPADSLAAKEQFSSHARNGVRHALGNWFDEKVAYHSIYSEEYGKTLTVLILDDLGGYSDQEAFDEDTELLTDSHTNFINNDQKPHEHEQRRENLGINKTRPALLPLNR